MNSTDVQLAICQRIRLKVKHVKQRPTEEYNTETVSPEDSQTWATETPASHNAPPKPGSGQGGVTTAGLRGNGDETFERPAVHKVDAATRTLVLGAADPSRRGPPLDTVRS